VSWQIVYTKQAQKDAQRIKAAGLRANVLHLLEIIKENPWQNPPPMEKLVGDLAGAYSRRINIQHRLIYQIIEERQTVKIIRLWTHYE
jgi:toxin YoeB